MDLSRRTVLGSLGGLVVGGAVAGLVGNVAAAEKKQAVIQPAPVAVERFAQVGGDFSWKPHMLNPDEVATVAHAGYHHKGYG